MNLRVRHSVLLVFLLLILDDAWGIDYTYRLNMKSGLASDEVYSVSQDNNGLIWFTTDNGISVFDGFKIHNYTLDDGLLDNVVFKQCFGKNGRIWFVGLNRKLFYFQNKKFYPALNKTGDTLVIPRKEIMEMFAVEDSIFVSTSYATHKVFPDKGCFNMETLLCEDTTDHLVFHELYGHYCVVYSRLKYWGEDFIVRVHSGNDQKLRYTFENNEQTRSMFRRVYVDQEDVYLTFGNTLCYFQSGELKRQLTFPNNIIHLECMNGKADVFVMHKGFYPVNLRTDSKIRNFYEDITITQRYVDREGGTWMTTSESGVLYDASYTKGLLFVDSQEKFLMTLIASYNENEIWYANSTGDLVRLSGHHFDAYYDDLNIKEGVLNLAVSDSLLVISSRTYVEIYSIYDDNCKLIQKLPFTSFAISNIVDNQFYLTDGTQFMEYRGAELLHKIPFTQRVYAMLQSSDTLYFGTNSGLYYYDRKSINQIALVGVSPGERFQVIQKRGSRLFLGTKSSGLIIYDLLTQSTKKITQNEGRIADNCVNDIEIVGDSILVIGTPKGISLLRVTDESLEIENFDVTDGMVSDRVKSLTYFQSYLLWGTYDGLFGWPLDKIETNKVSPITTIQKVELLDGGLFQRELNYDQNNLRITFTTSAFRDYGQVKAKYRLHTSDPTFYPLDPANGILTLNSLEPGEYDLEIYTSNNSGVWSENPAVLEFSIAYPFWQTWPFIVTMMIIGGVVIYLVFHIRLEKLKRDEKEKAKMQFELEQLKMKALRLQINPHFMFNALNNIQGYYASGDIQLAKDYIYQLSRLLRLILETSKDEIISLEKELEVVNYYVELNKIRYNNRFIFDLVLDAGMDIRMVEMPPMVSQPFIENAFVHALSDNRMLLIQLKVELRDDLVVVEISDNGSRLNPASLLALKNSGAVNGIGITVERVRSVNLKNGYLGEPVEFVINQTGGLTVRIVVKQVYDAKNDYN